MVVEASEEEEEKEEEEEEVEEEVEVVDVAQGVADLVDIQAAILVDIQVVTQAAILQEELPL